MSRSLILLASLAGLTGCIIHDNNCADDDFWGDEDGATDADGDGWPDEPGDDTDDATGLGLAFSPDTIAQGDTAILSLTAQADFDYASVSELVFYGDVEPCTISARADELLVTVSAYDDAALGPVDLVIELQDGQALWVEDALSIISPDEGTDGGSTDAGSTDGGSTDGGSTDGGSTDGGSTDGGC